jgi:serine/threonine-protein kinase RIM15
MVMEKLLEKLRCRTISASTGSEAVRYSMSDIKFDIIFMEFKLPQINGADVARMIRETKNANSHTPIVAITAYLKELQAPHYFDSLIEKPISSSKLTEVLGNLCQWKPSSHGQAKPLSLSLPHPIPSGLRQESSRLEDSPTSGSSGYAHRLSSSFREDSIGSSLFGDSESVSTVDDIPVVVSKATGDWDEGGLNISGQEERLLGTSDPLQPSLHGHLVTKQQSAPAQMEHSSLRVNVPVPKRSLEKLKAKRESIEKRRNEGSVDSADDEDDELGLGITASNIGGNSNGNGGSSANRQHHRSKSVLPSSKLGIEMMRANSHDSVTVTSSDSTSTLEPITQVVTPNREFQMGFPKFATTPEPVSSPMDDDEDEGDTTVIHIQTPPEDEDYSMADVEETPRPTTFTDSSMAEDDAPTPRPPTRVSGGKLML